MSKVVVGMSGGVDSAAAAYLLKLKGYEVIGLTLRSWVSANGQESRCCEIEDARMVADKLQIPYYVVNCFTEFTDSVTGPFIDDYLHGLTPNPCVICNRKVKWEKMMSFAASMRAEYVATGHYASVIKLENGRYTVQKAEHAEKDQTYMLYRLTQSQLAATLMPLGKLSKQEVRSIAAAAGLPVAAKADSQEICFVPDGNYADYIEENAEIPLPPAGSFVDEAGNVIGEHKGIYRYTVGQRKGLGLPLGYHAYVKKINTDKNEIVIGTEESLYGDRIICGGLNFMGIPEPATGETIRCSVKIRYHHPGQDATVKMLGDDRAEVTFDEPVRAATPGQSAVFYDEQGCVIGGGVITG